MSSFLREFPAMRAAFEFRHDSWFDDEIFDLLKSRNIALCIADTDTIATPRKITADYGFLQLRREDYQTTKRRKLGRIRPPTAIELERRVRLFQARGKRHGPKLAQQMVGLLEQS